MMNVRRARTRLILVRTCWLLIVQPLVHCCVIVAAPQPEITGVSVGFDGFYKVGVWTPVAVRASGIEPGSSARVDVTVQDGDGSPARYVAENLVARDRGAESEFVVFVKFGRIQGNVQVELVAGENVVASQTFVPGEIPAALPADRQLIVHLGADAGVEDASQKLGRSDIHVARLEPDTRLPDDWWGYEGIDTLVITTGSGNLDEWISTEQTAAMRQWMRMGGQIILSVGRHGDSLFAAEGLLREFAPGKFQGVVDQCQTIGIENFTDTSHPVGVRRTQEGKCTLQLAVFDEPTGKVEAAEGPAEASRPVVIRTSQGFGQLVFVAVDLDLSPISEWAGREELMGRLLEWTLGKSTQQQRSGSVGAVRHAGYADLAGQLRSAMDHFTEVTFVPFWLVATLMVIYVLFIGPVDYFLLKQGLRRMEWTWLTFPLMVLGFSLLAYFLANQLKGNALRINQVDIVDVDGRQRFVRGTTLSHVFSPATQSFDFAQQPNIPSDLAADCVGQTLLSWHGLPGDALGGMNSKSTAGQLSDNYVIRSSESTEANRTPIVGLPMQIWSTKALQSRWWLDVDLGSLGKIRATLDGQLRGEVRNPLKVDLAGCYLYFAPWAYQLGKIPAGQTFLVGTSTVRRNLHWRLTRRTLSEVSDLTTPWDQYSRDIPRIIEMMMFHAAAGGEKYTGLQNRYQSFVDMSNHLSIGEAVLVGRTTHPATELRRGAEPLEDDYDRRWAFYRFVIPIEPQPADASRA